MLEVSSDAVRNVAGSPSKVRSVRPRVDGKSHAGPKLLSIGSSQKDHTTLRRILSQTHWQVAVARTCRKAKALLYRRSVSAIFCECDLPDGTWRDILSLSANIGQPPPVIVTSRLADNRLWAEVLNLGGYDVLAKPFHEQEVRHVLASAGYQFETKCHAAAGLASPTC